MERSVTGNIVQKSIDVEDNLVENLFYMGFHNNADTAIDSNITIHNKRLSMVFKSHYKKEYPDFYKSLSLEDRHKRLTPLFLYSNPKEQEVNYLSAAKKYCNIMGLNLIKNPLGNYTPKLNDFIFYIVDYKNSELKKENYLDFVDISSKAVQGLIVFNNFLDWNWFAYMSCVGIIKTGVSSNGKNVGNFLVGLTGSFYANEDKNLPYLIPDDLVGHIFSYEVSNVDRIWKDIFK